MFCNAFQIFVPKIFYFIYLYVIKSKVKSQQPWFLSKRENKFKANTGLRKIHILKKLAVHLIEKQKMECNCCFSGTMQLYENYWVLREGC